MARLEGAGIARPPPSLATAERDDGLLDESLHTRVEGHHRVSHRHNLTARVTLLNYSPQIGLAFSGLDQQKLYTKNVNSRPIRDPKGGEIPGQVKHIVQGIPLRAPAALGQ